MPISDFDSTISKLAMVARKNGHASSISRSNPGSAARSASPAPYHPGSMTRACAQLNTQGIARRSSIRCELERDAGRDPVLRSEILTNGVICRKKVVNPPLSYTRERYARKACSERAPIAAAKRELHSLDNEALSSDASTVAAVMDSRFAAAL